jgi:hypothetical protein
MTTTELSEIDHDALTRALAMEREQDPAGVDDDLQRQPWEAAARSAAYHCQCRALKLKPWLAPPSDAGDVVTHAPCYGHRPEEVALRRRLLATGISIYEPDPLGALEAAEAGAA